MSSEFKIFNLALRRLGQDPIASIGEETENYRKISDIKDLLRRSLLRSHPWSFNKKEVALSRVVATDTPTWAGTTVYAVGDYVINTSSYKCLIAHTSGVFATDLTAGYWVLAIDYETPVLDDYACIFQLPSDFLHLNKTSGEPDYSHKIKGRKLYSNSDTISIEYGYDCKDPDAWVAITAYKIGDYVLQSNIIYYCLEEHTSAAAFATDLAADKWVEQDIYDASFSDLYATALAYDLCIPITQDDALKKILGEELKTKLNLSKSLNGQEVTPDSAQQDEWLNSRI